MNTFVEFLIGTIVLVFRGGKRYYAWMLFLAAVAVVGMGAWVYQLQHGLVITGMRDPVSWGLYIGNFTFMVGVAAGAVIMVLPAYLYRHRKIIGNFVARHAQVEFSSTKTACVETFR